MYTRGEYPRVYFFYDLFTVFGIMVREINRNTGIKEPEGEKRRSL